MRRRAVEQNREQSQIFTWISFPHQKFSLLNLIIPREFLQLREFCSSAPPLNESLFLASEMFVIVINMPSNYSLLPRHAY